MKSTRGTLPIEVVGVVPNALWTPLIAQYGSAGVLNP